MTFDGLKFYLIPITGSPNNLFPKSKQANHLNHLNWCLRFNRLLLGNVFDFFSLRNSQKTKKYTNTEVWFLKLLTHCPLHFGVVAVTQTFTAALAQRVLPRTKRLYYEISRLSEYHSSKVNYHCYYCTLENDFRKIIFS